MQVNGLETKCAVNLWESIQTSQATTHPNITEIIPSSTLTF